jgi:hypothetical protein
MNSRHRTTAAGSVTPCSPGYSINCLSALPDQPEQLPLPVDREERVVQLHVIQHPRPDPPGVGRHPIRHVQRP